MLVLWVWHNFHGHERLEQAEAEKVTRATCYNLDRDDNGGRSFLMSSVNFSTPVSSFTILVFHVSGALLHLLILVMWDLETHIALPFPFLTVVSICSTAFSRSLRAFCNVDLVAFAAHIQSALFEGASSSSRERDTLILSFCSSAWHVPPH